ncbi:hypothetical protein PYCCODRAFT_1361536 [Trametes coccinea BRFM310]|uniref:Uncharacterized protein n=1 Tax=Trametes coccinea (strain BRFM310) TaxID=1353009 RepID=A0A1Y2IXF5_TRAC3|nr:hypothetical protein PYCCODRAFT_1361536 [Trametes coccinea BRFM310]
MANPSEAERLKAEGNALFVKNDFSRAYEKFTQAIKHDEENAILYSNRAACSLGLSRVSCSRKLTQATELDPTYAKAWARLASACGGLDKYQEAITAWRRALAVLPVENLTAAQQKQRDLYAGKLAEAINNAERATVYVPAHVTLSIREEDKPWNRASKVLEALIPTNTWNSSAWVMVSAFTNWSTASEMMQHLRVVQTPAGPGLFGLIGVVEALTNAVIEDTRAFVLTDQDFFEKYNRQVMVEITKSRAWTDGSARTVMEEAPKRVQSEGWETTRLALSVTVRAWIMRAFIQENLIGGTWAALDFYTSAIEVIRWGVQRWADVPVAEKGSIFQPTFLRGVSRLRLDACLKAYKENPGPSSKMPLSEIFAGANELLNELASAPDEPTDEHGNPMFLCFTRYPLAAAHSFLGFYHQHAARNARQAGCPNAEVSHAFQAAAKAYLQSADIYPQDDEKRILTLHFALDALLEAGSPAFEILALMKRIRDDIPVIKRIWEFSADAVSGRDTELERDMSLRNRLLTRMQEGKIAHDDTVQYGMF